MYCLCSALTGRPIVSLQTGQIIARIAQPILEISNLEVVALLCQSAGSRQSLLLISSDIRQYAADCVIVDNEDELTSPNDIARLDSNLKGRYSPIGKPVVEESGHKLGTVEDYAINFETNHVQKLHVRRSFFQGLFSPNLIIDRTQITDIAPDSITVRDLTVTEPLLTPGSVPEA